MQQPEAGIQHLAQHRPRPVPPLARLSIKPGLYQLQVPVAELVPEEPVESGRRFVQSTALEVVCDLFRHAVEP